MASVRPDWLDEVMISKALGGSKTILDMAVKPAVPKGEHFLSTILRIEVKYKDKQDETAHHSTSLVVKTFPPGYLKTFIQESGLLTKEIAMYSCILPIMSNILGKLISPKFFESCVKDVLILEDLSLEEFRNRDRTKMLDYEHCVASIKVLADFHGASVIMNKRHPELIQNVKKEVQFTNENQFQKVFINNCFVIVSEEVKNWPGCEKLSVKLRNVKEKMWNQTVTTISPNENEIMVLCHGDFWTNNILFRYNKEDQNQIQDVKTIDFQFCRWTTPAIDLRYFFTTSVRNKECIPSLIDIYLTRFNALIQPHYLTKAQLIDALHRTECYGLVLSVSMLPMMILDPSKALDFIDVPQPEVLDGTNNNPLIRIACKDTTYKTILPERLKHYEAIGLLE